MDINYGSNNNGYSVPQPDAPINQGEKKGGKKEKKRILSAILAFCVLIFIVNACILADSVHTKIVAYKALDGFVDAFSTEEKAETQGNLGNYNVKSNKNSIADNKDGTRTLTLELEFTNYGKEGTSFSEAVSVTAYQNDKEIKGVTDIFSLGGENEPSADESDVKVRNGKKATVILKYVVKDATKDVNVDMSAGDKEFTYTVKLSEAPQKEENTQAEKTEKETETSKKN